MIKRYSKKFYIISFFTLIISTLLVSCQNITNNDTLTPKITNELEGVWGKNNELYTSFEFVQFAAGQITFGTYCGHLGRDGNITKITQKQTGYYEMEIIYPAVDDYFDESLPEETLTLSFYLNKNEITFNPSSNDSYTYEFMGKDLEEAIYTYENIWENIPKINDTIEKLNQTLTDVKRNLGNYVNGPSNSWKNIAVTNFKLYNLNDIDCYYNVNTKNEIMGFKNEEIIFRGLYGLFEYSMKIKEVVNSKFLSVNPKICTITTSPNKVGFSLYIWKLENGYVCITATNFENTDIYNQLVSNVLYIKDLKYLAYYY